MGTVPLSSRAAARAGCGVRAPPLARGLSCLTGEQLFDQLLLLSTLLQDDQERELGAIGLNPRRTHVLWLVDHQGPLMQRDISDQMEVSPRHVTTLVDELVEAGLVRRAPHPDDRRAVLVSLSEKGASLMQTMTADHVRLSEALTVGWSDDEVDDLRARIQAIVARFIELVEEAAATRAGGGS